MDIEPINLTAFALGELEGEEHRAEREAVQAFLEADAGALHDVQEVRAVARMLSRELDEQAVVGLTELQRAVIDSRIERSIIDGARNRQVEQKLLPSQSWAQRRRAQAFTGAASRSLFLTGESNRRWNRAVFGISLAASILIVGMAVAYLMPMLHHLDQMARQNDGKKNHGLPYIADGHTPPDLRLPDDGSLAQGGPRPVVPKLDPADAGAAWHRGPTSGPVIALNSEEDLPVEHPLGGLLPPALAQGTPAPATLRTVRGGLKRGEADGPQEEGVAAIAKPRTPGGKFYSSPPFRTHDGATTRPVAPAADPVWDAARFSAFNDSPFLTTAEHARSSFAADVDTASYAMVRHFLAHNRLPPAQAVHIEELLNYFPLHLAVPAPSDAAFAAQIELAPCPWNVEHRLARVAIKAHEGTPAKRPPVNLVFLVDLSSSMGADNKLPLLKKGMKLLLGQLGAGDRLSIVGASQHAWFFLPPFPCDDRITLLNAIDRLEASGNAGSTPGIETAYYAAASSFSRGGINRVLLATDGTWSSALAEPAAVVQIIEDKSKSLGISLGVLAMGNPAHGTDAALRRLAAAGRGTYIALDTPAEAKKVLADQVDGSLVEVARDVKTQVDFDPAVVSSYRLLGYETHLLPADDFDDAVVVGASVGAGHGMTALYEIVPAAQKRGAAPAAVPAFSVSVKYTDPVTGNPGILKFIAPDKPTGLSKVSNDFKFAAGVAEFGMLLRSSSAAGNSTWSSALDLVTQGKGPDETGQRQEFIDLVRKAKLLAKG